MTEKEPTSSIISRGEAAYSLKPTTEQSEEVAYEQPSTYSNAISFRQGRSGGVKSKKQKLYMKTIDDS